MSPRIFYIFTRNKIILIIFFFLKKIHRFIEEMFHIVIKIFVCSIWWNSFHLNTFCLFSDKYLKTETIWQMYIMDCIMSKIHSRSGGIMVRVHALSAVDRGFEPRSGQTKNYTIDIYCFSAKHTALRRKIKDWFSPNHANVSEWATYLSADCCFSELAL